MKLEQFIKNLEFGLNRAENESWIAFSIAANQEATELLEDLKRVKEDLEQAEWEKRKGGTFC